MLSRTKTKVQEEIINSELICSNARTCTENTRMCIKNPHMSSKTMANLVEDQVSVIQEISSLGFEPEGEGKKMLQGKEEKGKEKEKKQEKNLTVKPIRLLQDARVVSLKKAIKFRIRVDNVRPLDSQVAGHGSEAKHKGSNRGMLLHEAGFVLKPVQAPPKGEREVDFYHHISTSPNPVDREFYSYMPKFYGTEAMRDDTLDQSQFLILENITQGMTAPCVMDIKIGARTYGPDATELKIRQEDSKYLGTKKTLGFSVLGIITYSKEDRAMKRWDKSYGMNLSSSNVSDILEIYLAPGNQPAASKRIANSFLDRLNMIADFFERQETYHVFASSLLFAFDHSLLHTHEGLDQSQPSQQQQQQLDELVRLKMIDFAHVFPANGRRDQNFLLGVQNLQSLFKSFSDHIGI